VAFGQKYKFADNEIAGWKQNTDSADTVPFAVYTDVTLAPCRIDGAAPAYTSKGCKLAMYQEMVGPSPNACEVIAMDFVTEDNATSMVTYQQKQTSAAVTIPQYDLSVAIAYPVISGITVFAHFKASYFEVSLTGYADQNAATQDAALFLNVLKSKSN
jgi:hypothetical protein